MVHAKSVGGDFRDLLCLQTVLSRSKLRFSSERKLKKIFISRKHSLMTGLSVIACEMRQVLLICLLLTTVTSFTYCPDTPTREREMQSKCFEASILR